MTPNQIMASWQQKLLDVAAAEGRPKPLPKYGADGFGGHETQAAIIAFQTDHGLPITGQFDDATRAALNPQRQHVSSLEVAVLSAALSHLPFIPPELKGILMLNFPTIVQTLVGLLPGIPDDFNTVVAEIHEQASGDGAVAKIRSAALFARRLADALDQVANTQDPAGAIQPSVPLPPPMK